LPNHCFTRCVVTGSTTELSRFRTTCIAVPEPQKRTYGVASDNKQYLTLDFQRIIPMPPELENTVADSHVPYQVYYTDRMPYGDSQKSVEEWRAELDVDPANRACADRDHELVTKYGYYDWYEWRRANWFTKWNSYGFDIVDDSPERFEFTFDTAWTFPLPIFEKLAIDFPALRFECSCYEGGVGFGGTGFFGAEPKFEFGDATDELYAKVYGCPLLPDDDEPVAAGVAVTVALTM